MGKLLDKIRNTVNPAKVITDTALEVANGAADIIDRFVTTPDDKEKALAALREFTLDERRIAADRTEALLNDRASARSMASVHNKLQRLFAMAFLIGFFVVTVGELVFIALLIKWEGTAPISQWAQGLIASLLGGILGYMVSMVKEIVGFLFGGSAGGDDASAQIGQALQTAANANGGKPEPEETAGN